MTLTPQGDAKRLNTPPLQGRGRGWGLSANTIARNHRHATAMRRDPTEPERRLWFRLRASQFGGFKFRRQAAIGTYIVDFLCPAASLIVEVDGDTHADPAADARRDAALSARGYRVVRATNEEVMRNLDGVLEHLLLLLTASPLPFRGGAGDWASLPGGSLVERPHPNPSPEGEGLERVEAHKLLGISLEGSVG